MSAVGRARPSGDSATPSTVSWTSFVDGVRTFVARRVPPDAADDVAQDVFLRLHRAADRLEGSDRRQVGAWVYGIARRTVADHFRRRARAPSEPVDAPEEIVDPAPPRDEIDAHEEVLSWLRPMADELPATAREALLLADFEGLPQREVAARLGLGLSGAKSRIQRARRQLGESLRRCCAVELDEAGRAVAWRRRGALETQREPKGATKNGKKDQALSTECAVTRLPTSSCCSQP